MEKKSKKNGIKAFLYALPGIVWVFITCYCVLWGWVYAFYNYKPGRALSNCEFAGLKNFTVLFGNPVMRANLLRVIKNTLGIHMLGYLFSPLPMFFAVFLSEVKSKKFQKVVQTVSTLPHFISWVIMFSLCMGLFGNNGAVNQILRMVGSEATVNILSSPNHVWLTQTLLSVWKGLGWSAIVYFSAVAGVDQEMYEAAVVDGAGKMQRIWYITMPQMIPTFFVLQIMSIGNVLRSGIEQPMVFGNAMNMNDIENLDLYVYHIGIGSGMISYSIAVGIMTSVISLALFGLANFTSKKVRGSSVF